MQRTSRRNQFTAKCCFLCCAVAAILLLNSCGTKTPSVSKPQPHYQLRVLKFPATGINDKGEMFGVMGSGKMNPASQQPNLETEHLASCKNGTIKNLGILLDEDWCQPQAINTNGEIVGTVGPYALGPGDTSPWIHSFLWSRGKMYDLGLEGQADGINEASEVVGEKTWPDGQHGFLYSHGKMQEIKNPLSSEYSEVKAINNKGQMVGVASGPSQRTGPQPNAIIHVFIWNKGIASEIHLPEYSGHVSTYSASAINDAGQVIINAGDVYLWQNGTVVDLGTLPDFSMSAVAINNQGQIIGNAVSTFGGSPQNQVSHPFLWQSGTLYDLTDIADLNGWTMTQVLSLNNRGQIVGYGIRNGVSHAFLLTPITKP